MDWEVEVTDEFRDWFGHLDVASQQPVTRAVDVLEISGPALGRPLVDAIKQSRHANMKELRPKRAHLRILFAFDPRRMAILLLGGSKAGQWRTWYTVMVPIADELYDDHLRALHEEGLLP